MRKFEEFFIRGKNLFCQIFKIIFLKMKYSNFDLRQLGYNYFKYIILKAHNSDIIYPTEVSNTFE